MGAAFENNGHPDVSLAKVKSIRTSGHSIAAALLAACLFFAGCRKESGLRSALERKSGVVELPSGDIDLSRPLIIEGASGLTIRGTARSRLRMKFDGRAALLILRSKNVKLENFAIEGNRESADRRLALDRRRAGCGERGDARRAGRSRKAPAAR